MKIKYIPAAVLILICASVAIRFYMPQHKKHIALFTDASESIGGDSDAEARNKWELMRLADPSGKIPDHMRIKELAFAYELPKLQQSLFPDERSVSSIDRRGPWNVGGRTRALAVDIANDSVVFAGSVSGGLWRTADAGVTWARVSPADKNPSVTYIVQDTRPGHTNVWYFGAGEGTGTSASGAYAFYLGDGIYKSTDNGITWNILPNTFSGTPAGFNSFDVCWRMAVDPSDLVNDVVYTATLGGIFKSINGGNTWALDKGTGFVAGSSYYTDVDVTTTGIVYATLSSDGSQKGIWRKNSSGWANITSGAWSTATYERIVIGISPSNENEVYFLGVTDSTIGKVTTNYLGGRESNGLWRYTYLSGNGTGAGGQWTNLSANIPYDSSQTGNFNSQGGYDLVVRVHPDSSNIVYIGGTNLFRSKDSFTTSNNTTTIGGFNPGTTIPFYDFYPNHHCDQHNLFFLPSNHDVMFSSSDGGVTKTQNNRTMPVVWQSLNDGYVTSQFYTVAIDHGSTPNDIIIGGTQDNGTWFTNNTSYTAPWTMPSQGDGSFCAIDDGHANYYISRQEGKTARATLDGNGIVTAFRRIDPIGGSNYLFINPFILDANNNNIMYMAADNRIWRNDSLTQIPLTGQWDTISMGWYPLPDTIPVAGTIVTALAISKTPANRLYYGTNKKRVYRVDNSNTMNPVTTEITAAIFNANGYVSCIAVHPSDADKIMVAFSNYSIYSLYYSSDGGTSWTRVAGNLEQSPTGSGNGPSLRWASIIPVSTGTVYLVGTSVGLFGTNSLNGLSTVWTQLAPNEIGNMVVDMMDFRTSDGLVAVATHGAGVFSTYVSDTLATNLAEINPFSFHVTVFPNPTSGNAILQFYLNVRQNIVLTVYDAAGNVLESFVNGDLGSGQHEFTLQRRNRAPGIYFIRLQANGKSFTKKIVFAD